MRPEIPAKDLGEISSRSRKCREFQPLSEAETPDAAFFPIFSAKIAFAAK